MRRPGRGPDLVEGEQIPVDQSHGRYVTFRLAVVAVPRDLFRSIPNLIDDLRPRPVPA
jgi:hypothetical protein